MPRFTFALLLFGFVASGCDSTDSGIDVGALATVFGCDSIREIAAPSTTAGSLSSSDCDAIRGDTYADYYAFELTEASTVTITQSSTAQSSGAIGPFDSILALYNATSRTPIASDDDSAGGVAGYDARISQPLQPGVYVVEAADFDGTTSGSYTLSITTN